MKDHEKRIREALADLDGFYHDDTVEWTTNVSATDLRALLADLDAMRADARRYAAFFTSGLPVALRGRSTTARPTVMRPSTPPSKEPQHDRPRVA